MQYKQRFTILNHPHYPKQQNKLYTSASRHNQRKITKHIEQCHPYQHIMSIRKAHTSIHTCQRNHHSNHMHKQRNLFGTRCLTDPETERDRGLAGIVGQWAPAGKMEALVGDGRDVLLESPGSWETDNGGTAAKFIYL